MMESEPPGITVDIAPYGAMKVYAPETDRDLLSFVEGSWTELWPSVRTKLEAMCVFSDVSEHLKNPEWIAAIQRIEPDVFMGDKAELLFSVRLGETRPEWDFFLNGVAIIHSQPVY